MKRYCGFTLVGIDGLCSPPPKGSQNNSKQFFKKLTIKYLLLHVYTFFYLSPTPKRKSAPKRKIRPPTKIRPQAKILYTPMIRELFAILGSVKYINLVNVNFFSQSWKQCLHPPLLMYAKLPKPK